MFDFPKYGIAEPMEDYSLYTGPDHCSGIALNGKFLTFTKWILSWRHYWGKLLHIPEQFGEVDSLPIVDMKGGSNTNIDFNKEDLGPGPEQFDKLGVEEDVTPALILLLN